MKEFKKVFLTIVFIMVSLVSMGASYVWTPTVNLGSNTYDWGNVNNWRVAGAVPGAQPGALDDVVINISGNQTINLLNSSVTLNSLQLITTTTGASISFYTTANPYTFTTAAGVTMTAPAAATGVFGSNQPINYVVGTAYSVTNVRIGYAIQTSSATTAISRATFGSTCSITLNSGGGSSTNGGNTFNDNLQITTNSGYTSNFIMGATYPDIFKGTVALIKNGTGGIYMSNNTANNIYEKAITLSSSTSSGFFWGNGGNGTTSFAGTAAINGILASGNVNIFNITQAAGNLSSSSITTSSGTLVFTNITHRGALTLSASGCLTISGSTITGVLQPTVGCFVFTSSTFSTTTITLVSGSTQSSSGGCTYNADVQITTNTAYSGQVVMGNSNSDIFLGKVDLIKNGSASIYMSHNSVGNTYSKPITFYSSGAGAIYFGNGYGTSILNGTACFTSLAGYMTAGAVNLRNITKTSSAASTIVVGAGGVALGSTMAITGDLTIVAQYINLNGDANPGLANSNTFEDNVDLTYTGTGNFSSYGGNLFKKALKVTNTASTATTIFFGTTYHDQVNGDLTVVNTGALRTIIFGKAKNFDLRGNVYVNNTNTGSIQFGDRTTTGVFLFATDKKIFVGTDGGVTNGYINFNSVNQAMPTDASSTGFLFDLKIPNGTCATIITGDLSIFRSRVEFEAPEILILGGQFYNYTTLTVLDGCTVARAATSPALPTLGSYIARHSHFYMDLTCNVKNTLQSNPTPAFFISADAANTNETVLVDGNLILEQLTINSRPITVCTNATVKITVAGNLKVRHGAGNNHITVAANGQATVNGNIELSKAIADPISIVGTGLINLGTNVTTSLFTHNGADVVIEDSKSFLNGGGISFNYFKQTNSSGQISLPRRTTPTVVDITSVNLGFNSDFKSQVTVNATTVTIFQASFSREAISSMVVLNSWSTNSNIKGIVNFGTPTFPADVSFTHNTAGTINNLIINTTTASNVTFYGNFALFATNATGLINSGSTTNGTSITNIHQNLTYTNAANTTVPTFFATTNFLGSANQYLNYTSTAFTFQHPTINKPAGKLFVQKDVNVTGIANFTNGIMVVPSTNTVSFKSGSTVPTQSLTSYIDGRAEKIGNVAFTFPIGKGTIYAPLAISAPCNTSAAISAEYFPGMHPSAMAGTLPTTMPDISINEYWRVTCPNTYSCSVAITLPWNVSNYGPINRSVMTVAKYISPSWLDAGSPTNTGNNTTGTVTCTATTAFVADYAYGYETSLLINTLNVYPAPFKTYGTSIDYFKTAAGEFISTSGSSPVLPPIQTRLASLNPQKLVVHPSINATCAQLDILPSSSNLNTPMSICMTTNSTGVFVKPTVAGNDMSADYYTYNSTPKELIFYSNKKPDGTVSIVNNLTSGSVWKKTSNPTLTFTVGGNVFAYADLKVKSVATGAYLPMGTVTYAGGILSWNGSSIAADGLYVYELSIGSTAGGSGATVYIGNMVVKMYE